MTTTLQRSYIAAIALNNMGVSLMERKCHAQATETFRSAVSIMRAVSSVFHDEPTDSSRPLHTSEELDRMLRQARRSLFNSCGSTHSQEDQANLCVLTENESATVVNEHLRQRRDSFAFEETPSYFIRIESTRLSIRDCGSNDPVLEAAIVLHNFGASHKFMARTRTDAETARECYHGAFVLCSFAYTVLRDPGNHEDFQDTEEFLSYYLPVSIIVLRSLVSLATMLGLDEDALAYNSEMTHRQDHFLSLALVFSQSRFTGAAAA